MRTASAAIAVLLSVHLAAQDLQLTDANVTFNCEFNATPLVYVATADFMLCDPGADPLGMLFKTAWAYRLNADTREFIFNDGGGQATFINAGSVGIATWNDVDSRNLTSATAIYEAVSTGAATGAVTCRMTISNISASPVTLNLFHLADIDLCGASFLTNTMTPGSNGHQSTTGVCTEVADHSAVAFDRWEVGSYTGSPAGNVDLYTRLEDGLVYDLANTAAAVGPFDMRGAYQWQNRVIQPGDSETYTVAISHQERACEHGFTRFGTGLGGSLGVPQLSSSGASQIGTTFTPTIANCPASALAILVLGFGKANTPIADLTLWVAPPLFNNVIVATPAGTATLNITLPSNPALCSTSLIGEGIVFDATTTSISGFPVTHTVGGHWVIGLY